MDLPDRRHGRRGGEWTWEEFHLPFETVPCDIHCVTKWSKLGTSFRGVSVDTLLEQAEPLDAYAMAYSYGGYTTNLPIEDLTDGKAWVVTEHEGEPLPREHGGPPGCSCHISTSGRAPSGSPGSSHGPRRARVLGDNGYHNHGDPWKEERYWTDYGGALTPVEQRAPGRWQVGTVTSIKQETPRVKSFRIQLPMWMPHLPGQHYDVRLTAPDGYRAERSYSVASSPLDEGEIELTIDLLADGEVSPTFTRSWSRVTWSRSGAVCLLLRRRVRRPSFSWAAGPGWCR